MERISSLSFEKILTVHSKYAGQFAQDSIAYHHDMYYLLLITDVEKTWTSGQSSFFNEYKNKTCSAQLVVFT